MNENQHEFPDELISAYLDDELSPAEKVRVEEQLMDSPEHRRLFEELKALRRSLQALPAESLGDDFAARVLRRAERELLADVTPVEKSKAKEPVVKAVVVEAPPVVARTAATERGSRRGLVWSIIATAAAVGLLTFGPLWNRPPQNISRLPDATGSTENAEEQAAPAEQISSPTDNAQAKNGLEFRAAPSASPVAEESFQVGDDQFKGNENRSAERNLLDSARELRMRDRDELKQHTSGAVDEVSSYSASPRFDNARVAANAESAPGAGVVKDPELEHQAKPFKEAAEQDAVEKFADGSPALGKTGAGDRFAQGFGGRAVGGSVRGAMALRTRDALQVAQSPRMGVVMLDVKREALAAKFFDQLLARHDIQVELARAEDEAEQLYRGERKNEADNAAVVNTLNEQADSALAEDAVAQGGGQGASAVLADDGADEKAKHDADGDEHADVDLMYVEATPEQIDALLLDLEALQGDVLAMAFDGVGPAKKSGQGEILSAEGSGKYRALAELKDLQLNEQAQLAAKVTRQNAAEQSAGDKPQATAGEAPSEVQADDQVAAVSNAAEPQSETRASEAAKSGVARRLSLQNLAQAEKQLRRGGSATAGAAPAQPAPAPVLADAPAEERSAALPAEASIEAEDAPEAPLVFAPAVEGATPSAPPANQPIAASDKLAKAKGQGLVRVLFVLRAVSPLAVEAGPAPADAAPAEPQN